MLYACEQKTLRKWRSEIPTAALDLYCFDVFDMGKWVSKKWNNSDHPSMLKHAHLDIHNPSLLLDSSSRLIIIVNKPVHQFMKLSLQNASKTLDTCTGNFLYKKLRHVMLHLQTSHWMLSLMILSTYPLCAILAWLWLSSLL